MLLTAADIEQIVDTIVNGVRPSRIFLFGSYARGQASEHSDLDLLVVMDTDEPSYKRSAKVRNLLWPPKAPMDILVYTADEMARSAGVRNHIVTDVLRNGKVMYGA